VLEKQSEPSTFPLPSPENVNFRNIVQHEFGKTIQVSIFRRKKSGISAHADLYSSIPADRVIVENMINLTKKVFARMEISGNGSQFAGSKPANHAWLAGSQRLPNQLVTRFKIAIKRPMLFFMPNPANNFDWLMKYFFA